MSTGRSLTTSTTFDIGSVSKQFTAAAVLLLVQDGTVGLEDPLARWVPGLPPWSGEVTIDDLIRHRSAIPDYTGLLQNAGSTLVDRTTQQQALAAVAEQTELPWDHGVRFSYSNSNYILLAEVVRNAAQQSLPDFARTRIFEPLELDMVIDPHGAHPDNTGQSSARAHVQDPTNDRWEPGGSRWEQVGDGSIQTTPSELVRWADTYRTGTLGGEWLLEAQLAGRSGDAAAERYAAGIVVDRSGALRHDGAWAGFRSTFRVSADRRTALAVSCNGDGPRVTLVDELTRELQALWT